MPTNRMVNILNMSGEIKELLAEIVKYAFKSLSLGIKRF